MALIVTIPDERVWQPGAKHTRRCGGISVRLNTTDQSRVRHRVDEAYNRYACELAGCRCVCPITGIRTRGRESVLAHSSAKLSWRASWRSHRGKPLRLNYLRKYEISTRGPNRLRSPQIVLNVGQGDRSPARVYIVRTGPRDEAACERWGLAHTQGALHWMHHTSLTSLRRP